MRLEAVANLAHELRTPVQVLLGYIDILREDYGEQFSSEPRALLDEKAARLPLPRSGERILLNAAME